MAAFLRWRAEWEASRKAPFTPLQDPQTVVVTAAAPTTAEASLEVEPVPVVPALALPERRVVDAVEPGGEDVRTEGEDVEPEDRPLALQPSAPDNPAAPENDDAPADASGVDTGAVLAPPPGAHAAGGILPWQHLMQGLKPEDEVQLRKSWATAPWTAYPEVLADRGATQTATREAAFLQELEHIGCVLPGPCQVDRTDLKVLAGLATHFAPEQWARLAASLCEGKGDPLETWRAIERENLAEAISVREPAFLRYVAQWGQSPRWYPGEWARRAPELGRAILGDEAAGLLDGLGEGFDEVLGATGAGAAEPVIAAIFGNPTVRAVGAAGARAALGGKLGTFAQHAVGALVGRTLEAPRPPPPPPPAPLPTTMEVADPDDDDSGDPVRVIAGGPHRPREWWRGLTEHQGLREPALRRLQATIEADGPAGIQHSIAVYQELLEAAAHAQRERRERHFGRILQGVQEVQGATFNPHLVPGDPFRKLRHRVHGWPRVAEALRYGRDPERVFHDVEVARVHHLVHREAPAQMGRLLGHLWMHRRGEAAGPLDAEAAVPSTRVTLYCAQPTPLYERPDPRSKQLVTLATGNPVRWIEYTTDGTWARVDPGIGEQGWVQSAFLSHANMADAGGPLNEAGAFMDEVVIARPEPLFHLGYQRAMSRPEFARFLAVVPALQAHPDTVLQEVAGLRGQALDVRGLDARTGEYLALPGETYRSIAHKLVGDPNRWRENRRGESCARGGQSARAHAARIFRLRPLRGPRACRAAPAGRVPPTPRAFWRAGRRARTSHAVRRAGRGPRRAPLGRPQEPRERGPGGCRGARRASRRPRRSDRARWAPQSRLARPLAGGAGRLRRDPPARRAPGPPVGDRRGRARRGRRARRRRCKLSRGRAWFRRRSAFRPRAPGWSVGGQRGALRARR